MSFWDVFGPALTVAGVGTGIGGIASPALAGAITGAGMGAMKGREKQQAVEDFNKYAKERTKYSWASGLQDIAPQMKPGIWGDIASQAGLGAMTGSLLGGAGGKTPVDKGLSSASAGANSISNDVAAQQLGGVSTLSPTSNAAQAVPNSFSPQTGNVAGVSPQTLRTMQMEQAMGGASSGLPELQAQMDAMNPYRNFWSLYGAQGQA